MLVKHFDRLSTFFLPMTIVQMLYSERVFTGEMLDELNRFGSLLGDRPLGALYTMVYKDPLELRVFTSVLVKSEQLLLIAMDVLMEYGK